MAVKVSLDRPLPDPQLPFSHASSIFHARRIVACDRAHVGAGESDTGSVATGGAAGGSRAGAATGDHSSVERVSAFAGGAEAAVGARIETGGGAGGRGRDSGGDGTNPGGEQRWCAAAA